MGARRRRRRVGREGNRRPFSLSLSIAAEPTDGRTAHFDPRLCNLDDAMDVMVLQPPAPARPHARHRHRPPDGQFEAVKVMPPDRPPSLRKSRAGLRVFPSGCSLSVCLSVYVGGPSPKCRIITPFRGSLRERRSTSQFAPITCRFNCLLAVSYVMRKRRRREAKVVAQ